MTKNKIITVLFIFSILVISFFADNDYPDIKTSKTDLSLITSEQQDTPIQETPSDIVNTENPDNTSKFISTTPVLDNIPPIITEASDSIPDNVNDSTATNKIYDNATPSITADNITENPDETLIQDEYTSTSDETNNVSSDVSSPELPAEGDDNSLYCTLSVNCISALKNQEKLKKNKKDILPENGIIFKETTVEFFPDESVFDVLHREMKNNKIQIDFVSTPMYNSIYIKGIANLYEFDCGDLSGWMYKVNGVTPTYGCSQYKLKNNDKIEFFYTCNMFN